MANSKRYLTIALLSLLTFFKLFCNVKAIAYGKKANESADLKDSLFMVAVATEFTNKKTILCSGAAITDIWVVTAAHCLSFQDEVSNGDTSVKIKDVSIIQGAVSLERNSEFVNGLEICSNNPIKNPLNPDDHKIKNKEAQIIDANKYYVPTKYTQECETYDIGLISLKKKIEAYQPLPIAQNTLSSGDAECKILGWGETETGQYSIEMKQGNVKVIDLKTCWDEVGFNPTAFRICAGAVEKERGISGCQGDGGSPLVCSTARNLNGFQIWGLYGVQNYYKSSAICGKKTNVVMYTRVSEFKNWIDCVQSEKSDSKTAQQVAEECQDKIKEVKKSPQECRASSKEQQRNVALIVVGLIFAALCLCGMVWAFAKRGSIEKNTRKNKEQQYVVANKRNTQTSSLYDDQLEAAAGDSIEPKIISGFDRSELPGVPKEGTEQNVYLNLANYAKEKEESTLEEL